MGLITDFIRRASPPTLQSGRAERYMYTLALAQEAILERAEQAILARFPQMANSTALPLLGSDRLIAQGLTEGNVSYAGRLRRALEDWGAAGNAFSVLGQVLGYLSQWTPRVRTVSPKYSNTWAASGGVLVRGAIAADSLSPVDGSGGWWWWWLIIYSTGGQAFAGPAPFKWGTPGVRWGRRPDCSWGLNVPPSVGAGLRALLRLWKPGNAPCRNIIISFSDALFDPTQPSGGGINPDGKFGRRSKIVGGVYVPARFSNARYLNGVI